MPKLFYYEYQKIRRTPTSFSALCRGTDRLTNPNANPRRNPNTCSVLNEKCRGARTTVQSEGNNIRRTLNRYSNGKARELNDDADDGVAEAAPARPPRPFQVADAEGGTLPETHFVRVPVFGVKEVLATACEAERLGARAQPCAAFWPLCDT